MNKSISRPYLNDPLVKAVSDCSWKIWKTTGAGMDETYYKKALEFELKKEGISCNREVCFESNYEGLKIGKKFIDLIVEGNLIVEAKACTALSPVHYSQLRTYLKLADQPYGILVNFGTAPLQFKIVVKDYLKQ